MSVLVLCLLVVGCVSVAWAGDTGAVSLAELQAYAKQYHKKYAPTEVRLRQRMLYNSRKEISALKKKHPLAVFELGVLSDRTPEEMKSMKGYKKMKESPPAGVLPQTPSTAEIPKAFDWRKKGAVTPVKNQGTCGSCWAFSATEGVESAWFLAGNNLTVLSPQQIVSCDSVDDGCFGGDLPPAFNYVKNNGMETAAAYPYHEPYDPWDWFCHYDESKVVAHISGFGYATRDGNETQMQAESLKHGPLSVCVATDGWQSYSGGVMKRGCGSSVDHCVQIVGWDSTSDGTPYWIVRNSWAADWGIDGFIWIERNEDECQIAGEATYAII